MRKNVTIYLLYMHLFCVADISTVNVYKPGMLQKDGLVALERNPMQV